jgi:hypothetical protein
MKTYIQLIIFFVVANSYAQNSVPFDTIYSKQITATKAHLGQFGKVTLQIDDSGHDGLITRPLIVAEGFDPGIIISPEAVNGINTYLSFIRSVNLPNELELEGLITGSTIGTTGDQEYDIIYVNWDNGVDFLQKNAYALEEVIKWVNEQKALAGSTEQNVVLGQSMGGVVARYALADMEQYNKPHDTRLFVSHDAPQQGANVPVAAQFLLRHATNLYFEFSTPFGLDINALQVPLLENSLLDQPATMQLLKNWSTPMYTIANTAHSTFYNDLRTKGLGGSGGYPTLTRNVAISNGAECGTSQNFNPGDDLLLFDTNGSLGDFLDSAASFIVGASSGNAGLIGAGIVSLIPGNGKFRANFNAKSIPYGTGNNIYKGRISYQKKLFSVFGWAPTITVNITNVEKNQPANVLPFDTYGGGKYEITSLSTSVEIPDGVFIRDNFGFIPSASALDIGKGTTALNDADYKMAYVGALPPPAPKDSPFSNFIADYNTANPNASNSAHISFNSRNGRWLARELTENPTTANCSFICDNPIIQGLNSICTNSIFNVPAGAISYNWSISGSSASITSNGNTATVTRNGQQSGSVTITVVINGGECGNVTLSKQIWVGVPTFNSFLPIGNQTGFDPNGYYISNDDGSISCNQISMKVLFNADAIVEYQWEKFTTDVNWGVSPTSGNLNMVPLCNKDFSFRVKARNSCGWSAWKTLEFYMSRCNVDCTVPPVSSTLNGNNFILSPNPVSSGALSIAIKSSSPWFYPPAPIDPVTGMPQQPVIVFPRVNITIYSQSGSLMQSYTNKVLPAQLDISSFAQGVYMVVFEKNGQTESFNIIKN